MRIWKAVLVAALVLGLPSLSSTAPSTWTEATLSPPESPTQSGQNDTVDTAAPIPAPTPSSPSGVSTGQTMIIGDIVKNQGAGSTGSTPFKVGFYLSKDKFITTSDTFLGSRSVSTLAAGSSSQAATEVRIPANLALGMYYIGAIADYTNVITETNESNYALAGNSINITHYCIDCRPGYKTWWRRT